MQAATTLDELSESDQQMISALLEYRGNLPLVARQQSLRLADLFAWLQRPDIRRALATIAQSSRHITRIRQSFAQHTAIDALEHAATMARTSTEACRAGAALAGACRPERRAVPVTRTSSKPRRPDAPRTAHARHAASTPAPSLLTDRSAPEGPPSTARDNPQTHPAGDHPLDPETITRHIATALAAAEPGELAPFLADDADIREATDDEPCPPQLQAHRPAIAPGSAFPIDVLHRNGTTAHIVTTIPNPAAAGYRIHLSLKFARRSAPGVAEAWQLTRLRTWSRPPPTG